MNILRKAVPEQVEALREPLFTGYKAVARFQMERTPEAEAKMRTSVGKAVKLMRPFAPLLPPYKRRYLKALGDASQDASLLPASDFLLLFDETVYQMHIRLSLRERGEARPLEPWGKALLDLLDDRRSWRDPV